MYHSGPHGSNLFAGINIGFPLNPNPPPPPTPPVLTRTANQNQIGHIWHSLKTTTAAPFAACFAMPGASAAGNVLCPTITGMLLPMMTVVETIFIITAPITHYSIFAWLHLVLVALAAAAAKAISIMFKSTADASTIADPSRQLH